jgi:CDGSH-type Zn-finger protein
VTTTVYVRPDGPYVVTGDFSLEARGAPHDSRSVVLCRCGRSSNKPFCDGSHVRAGFVDDGRLHAGGPEKEATATERLALVPRPNGPLKCTGPFRLSGADGACCERMEGVLCRCGASATKPWCDSSHKRVGFVG